MFPTKILLATDGSNEAGLAGTTAVSLAERTGSELHVVSVGVVAPPPFELRHAAPARAERAAHGIIDEQVRKIESVGGNVARSHARMGDAAKEVVDLAEKIGAGLIAIGSRGKGRIRRLALGSVSDSVVRHAHCCVMVVRSKPFVFPTRILLATDGSKDAAEAREAATDLARRTGSELHVAHAGWVLHRASVGWNLIPLPPGLSQEDLDRGARTLLAAEVERMKGAGADVEQAHMRSGKADEEIVVLAEELGADLIVMGCRGRGGVRRALMGSVSESVVRHAHCPVLVARA
jgi:nucleotide-binding universal stress UspA family protein